MNLVTIFIRCSLFITFPKLANCGLQTHMSLLVKELDLKQPTIVEALKEDQVKMMKQFSQNDILSTTKTKPKNMDMVSFFRPNNEKIVIEQDKAIRKGLLIFQDQLEIENIVEQNKTNLLKYACPQS